MVDIPLITLQESRDRGIIETRSKRHYTVPSGHCMLVEILAKAGALESQGESAPRRGCSQR